MKKFLSLKVGPIKLWWILASACLFIVGLLVGTFVDLSLSKAIASNDSFYGLFFESFGELLGYGVAPISGALISRNLLKKESKTYQKVIAILVSVITIGVASYYMSSNFSGQAGYSWKFNKVIGLIASLLIYCGLYAGTFFLIDDSISTKQLVTYGICVLLGMVIPVVLVNFVFKGLVYRARFRAMAWDNSVLGTTALGFEHYSNWYEFSFWVKPQWWLDTGLAETCGDFIKSWPSGHTACASASLCLPFVTACLKKTNDKKIAITYVIALVYTIAVAFARIVRGAHFLSDVSSGALLTILFMFPVQALTLKIASKKKQ